MSTPSVSQNVAFALKPDDEFYEKFHGADEIFGKGKAFELMDKFLEDARKPLKLVKVFIACVVFMCKPTRYTLEGRKTKYDNPTSQMVDDEIAKYLPRHADKAAMQEASNEAMEKRQHWPEAFKLINTTMIRRVAFLALEIEKHLQSGHVSQQTLQWISKHGGLPPSQMVGKAKIYMPGASAETIEIAEVQYAQWKADMSIWQPLMRKYATKIEILLKSPESSKKSKTAKSGAKGDKEGDIQQEDDGED